MVKGLIITPIRINLTNEYSFERRLSRLEKSYRNQAEFVLQALACPAHLVSIQFSTSFRTYSTGVRFLLS